MSALKDRLVQMLLSDALGIDDSPQEAPRLRIVVLDRGFVVVGYVTQSGDMVTIENCRCIRRWGTTAGLGELAYGGPLDETVLDQQPTTRVHILQVVQQIDCSVDKWSQ